LKYSFAFSEVLLGATVDTHVSSHERDVFNFSAIMQIVSIRVYAAKMFPSVHDCLTKPTLLTRLNKSCIRSNNHFNHSD